MPPTEPKMSELMRAAARGVMRPYDPPKMAPDQHMVQYTFDSKGYEEAKQKAGVFNALADVYEAHEHGE